MHIVWMSWKDREHPQRGGAEVVTDNILRRLVADGHTVTLLTADYAGAQPFDDMTVIRKGGRFSVYYHAWRYYRKHLRDQADVVIDEMNTIPFFASRYSGVPTILMVHQLARQIWFYQLPWFIGWIGYVLEPLYLFGLRNMQTLTVSESTRSDLMKYGFKSENIHIISEGIHLKQLDDLSQVSKYRKPTILSHGAMRPMKRTLDQIKAFEIAKAVIPNLQLKISGDNTGAYGQKVMKAIASSPYVEDIEYLGRVSDEKKVELMQRCHLITVTSTKEGWGLIVSEAASQGTPAVVYDIDGLRDSVYRGRTGVVTKRNTPQDLAKGIVSILSQPEEYETKRLGGWEASKRLTFDQCYRDFTNVLEEAV